MMGTSRQALLIGDPQLAGFVALSLQRFSWRIYLTSCLDEAEKLLQIKSPLLGIILLGPHHASSSSKLDRLLTLVPATLWVALLDTSPPQDKRLLELISRYCHAYLPLPLHPEQANHVLENALTMAGLLATNFSSLTRLPQPGSMQT